METRGQTSDGSGDKSGDGNRSGNGIEDGIGEGRGKGKKRKKPHDSSCRSDVGNRGDFGLKRKKRRQEIIGSVAADPDNLENSKKTGREAQGTQEIK